MGFQSLIRLLITINLWSLIFSIGHSEQNVVTGDASASQRFFQPLPLLPRNVRPDGAAVTRVKMQGRPREEGFALVKARIAGSPSLIFLVDTGFNRVLALDRTTAQRMKLLDGVQTKVVHDVECVYFKSFTIGEFTIDTSTVPTWLMDLRWMRALPGFQEVVGIIGFGFLRPFVTRIDYVQETLTLEFNQATKAAAYRVLVYDRGNKLVKIIPLTTLESPVLHLPEGGRAAVTTPVPIPLSQYWLEQRDMPVVRATVNEDYATEFFIDTGAQGTTIPRSLAEKIASERKIGGIKTILGNGQTVKGYATRVRSLVVGEKRLEQMVVYYFDNDPLPQTSGISVTLPQEMGVMGGDFLRHFEVTIDGPNGVVYLEGPYSDLVEGCA